MLTIKTLRIEGLLENCITDVNPNIAFSLESGGDSVELDYAIISVNGIMSRTKNQINNKLNIKLKPFTRYDVHVEAVTNNGQRAERSSYFYTGRLNTEWTAKWITDITHDFPKKASPIPMTFRYNFNTKNEISRAWFNVTALGVYELLFNGTKVGNDYFAPGFTSYYNNIQYQTYDVTNEVNESNEIIAVVAGGWAAGSFNYRRTNKVSADRQALLCELHIEYKNGKKEVIATNENWEVSLDGNYKMAEWYDGETYDANTDLNKIIWKKCNTTKPRKNPKISAQYGNSVRVQEILEPVEVSVSPSGETIYDFGQNFAGVIYAEIDSSDRKEVIFRHAEVLHNGELFVKSLRTAKATATYICKEGKQIYSPKLTYMGFRYVGIKGIEVDNIKLKAYVLHSDFDEIGKFECSNELINQLHHNIIWGGKSNFVDIPTDCPQRDERQGWTGDLSMFANTATFNFDLSRFLDKWLLDMRTEQARTGGIPMVVPKGGDKWPSLATAAWGDSVILVPWSEYLARGNEELLRKQYSAMKKFLKAAKRWSSFLAFTPSSRYVWKFPFHFGDWCAPDEDVKQWLKKGKWVATAYFANSCEIMVNIAKILGKDKDAEYYNKLRSKIVSAYRKVFTDGKGNLNKEFQTAYVLPLHFNMTSGKETEQMAKNLVKLVKKANNHLTTGFTGTPFILFALSDNGYTDVAFDLLLQETCPSWLYQVKAGATTIWERWDSLRPDGTVNIGDLTGKKSDEESNGGMVSFNHYANGAVGDWLYKRILGIESTSGGYKTFKIKPVLGGAIKYARGSTVTPYGTISSYWRLENNKFTIEVEVPVSTTCQLILPNDVMNELKSGKHKFICQL